MKRLIIFFMLGELLLLCSGCEKKELECVKVEESSKVKITQTVKVTFSKEKINVYKNHLIFDITDDKGNYKDLLYTELEKNFKEYTNKNGINYIIKKENKQIMINIEAEIAKLTTDEKEVLGFEDENGNYKETRKALEENNYSCK